MFGSRKADGRSSHYPRGAQGRCPHPHPGLRSSVRGHDYGSVDVAVRGTIGTCWKFTLLGDKGGCSWGHNFLEAICYKITYIE